MNRSRRTLAVLSFGLLTAGVAPAQMAAAASEPPQAAETGPEATPARRAEAPPDRRVVEDDHVRIEELRVRGQVRRVTVQSKVQGAREYEIIVGHGGRDPSQDRGNAGRSAWRVLGF